MPNLHETYQGEASWLERLENWQGWQWGRSYPWNKRRRPGKRRLANPIYLRNIRTCVSPWLRLRHRKHRS